MWCPSAATRRAARDVARPPSRGTLANHSLGSTMRPVTRLYDCVVFNDELDLLEVRLRTAGEYVDVFVIVEAPRTFSGDDKPLVFGENRERFRRCDAQIRHVVVDDLPPPVPTRWEPEVFQRDA